VAGEFDFVAAVFLHDVDFGEVVVDKTFHGLAGGARAEEFFGEDGQSGFIVRDVEAAELKTGHAGLAFFGGEPEAAFIHPLFFVVVDFAFAMGAFEVGGAHDAVEVPGAIAEFGGLIPFDVGDGDGGAVREF